MKLEFYFDVYPWTNQSNLGVFTILCYSKGSDCKRYKVEVEVPDPNPIDMALKVDAVEIKELERNIDLDMTKAVDAIDLQEDA